MRWLFRLLGVIIVAALVLVAGLFLVPADRIAAVATRQFEAATGRALTISGGVSPTLWPVIGARIEGVTLASVPGATGGPLLQADTLDVGVDLSALIDGALVIRRFEARAPRIVLERDASGRGNWVFDGLSSGAATTDAGPDPLPTFTLDRGMVDGASLRFIDHASGTDITINGITLQMAMPAADGPASLTLSATRSGTTLNADLQVGALAAFLAGDVVPVSGSFQADGGQGSFEGRAGIDPVALEGRARFEGARLSPLMAFAGLDSVEVLPEAARPLSFAGQVTLAPSGSAHLRDGTIGFGVNRINAALDLILDGERPRLSGEITATSLDLSGFTTGARAGGAAPTGTPGWSRERIDASALGLMDAQLALRTGAVSTGYGTIDAFSGALAIDRARAVLTVSDLRAFEGVLAGELVANNRSGLSVAANLNLAGLRLLPLLRDTVGFQRLAGTGDAQVRLLGVGNTLNDIMHSLEGQGTLAFSAGEIIGFDLAGMLRNLDMSYVGETNRTIFQSLNGSCTIQGGLLSNSDLALVSDLVTVRGEGTVDLGEQVLNYRVTPEAMRNAQTGESIRVPLLITGPWSEPRFRLDVESIAQQRLEEERARLEARAREEADRLEAEARDRVRQRVEEELGVQVQEGQSVEDTLREGVEQAARNRLLELLGGGQQQAPAAGN